MPRDQLVTMRLPDDLLRLLTEAARADGCSPADILRGALVRTLAAREKARLPRDFGVRDAVRNATGWTDLQSRLRGLGFMLRADGGSVMLHGWPRDRPLIRAEAAGIDPAALTLRFGTPFPGFAGVEIADDPPRPRMGQRSARLMRVA
jgi:hypothetical protein